MAMNDKDAHVEHELRAIGATTGSFIVIAKVADNAATHRRPPTAAAQKSAAS